MKHNALISVLTMSALMIPWLLACFLRYRGGDGLRRFDRAATVPLRGLLMMTIVIAHLVKNTGAKFLVGTDFYWQNYAVGAFFFMSGYGTMLAYESRSGYLSGYLPRLIGKLVVPMVLLMCGCAAWLLVSDSFSMSKIVSGYVRGATPLLPHSWFLIVLLVYSVSFYISARVLHRPHAIAVAMVVVSALMYFLFADVLCWKRWWWGSWAAYPVGLLFAHHEERVRGFITRNGRLFYLGLAVFFVLSVPAFAIVVRKLHLNANVYDGWVRALIGPVLAVGFYVLPLKSPLGVLQFLGVHAFDIYLVHGFVRKVVMCNGGGNVMGLVTLAATVAVAWVFSRVMKFLRSSAVYRRLIC